MNTDESTLTPALSRPTGEGQGEGTSRNFVLHACSFRMPEAYGHSPWERWRLAGQFLSHTPAGRRRSQVKDFGPQIC